MTEHPKRASRAAAPAATALIAAPAAPAAAQPRDPSALAPPLRADADPAGATASLAEALAATPWAAAALGAAAVLAIALIARRGGRARRARAAEARRLFAFFEARHGLTDATADDVIAYLARVAGSIDALRRRAEAAEAALARARPGADERAAQGSGAAALEPTATRVPQSPEPDPRPRPSRAPAPATPPKARIAEPDPTRRATRRETAPPQAGLEAMWAPVERALAAAAAAGRDLSAAPDYAPFARAAAFEATLRRLAACRQASLDAGAAPGADLIEARWPHALLRAEALLAAYYPNVGAWRALREAAAAAGDALRRVLADQGVRVARPPRLLQAFDPAEGARWSDGADALRALDPVRATVLAHAASGARDFVVDLESARYHHAGRGVTVRARLISFSPAAWR